MPALKPTEFTGIVRWLGRVTDQESDLRSEVLKEARLGFKGIEG